MPKKKDGHTYRWKRRWQKMAMNYSAASNEIQESRWFCNPLHLGVWQKRNAVVGTACLRAALRDRKRGSWDEHRTALVGHAREYFHVSCLEEMLDLPSLSTTRFKLDKEPYRWNDDWPWTWGWMLRLWSEHSGRIDLAKIKAYIKSHKNFEKVDGDFSTEYFEWYFEHQGECSAETRNCRCPPEPKGPTPPILEGYKTTTGGPYCLSEVLDHPYVEKQQQSILVNPPSHLYNDRAAGSIPSALL